MVVYCSDVSFLHVIFLEYILRYLTSPVGGYGQYHNNKNIAFVNIHALCRINYVFISCQNSWLTEGENKCTVMYIDA